MTVSKIEPDGEKTGVAPSPPMEEGLPLHVLDPQPGEIWVAWVGREPVAYGKTLKEAREKARSIRPDSEPVMDLIAWLWEVGFFEESEAGEGKRPSAVWI